MAAWLQHGAAAWRPRPVKRVFIPKKGGKLRGLGIPVIADRALQALAVVLYGLRDGHIRRLATPDTPPCQRAA